MKGTCEQIPFHFFLKFMMLSIAGGLGFSFSVLKVVQGGRTRTMVIAHSPAQRSSELTANCD